jgi:hypothetical protein
LKQSVRYIFLKNIPNNMILWIINVMFVGLTIKVTLKPLGGLRNQNRTRTGHNKHTIQREIRYSLKPWDNIAEGIFWMKGSAGCT